jgi:DNA-binding winged helix-turn-helix (wHTH) protein/tetratricopeptide (TPR) repeat protein
MTGSDEKPTYRFGPFVLDLKRSSLTGGGQVVTLRPKPQALLAYLAANRGRVVSKDELLSAVWPDVFVTEDSLTQTVREIRKAFGPEHEHLLRTISKRGYLLEAEEESLPSFRILPTVAVLRFRTPIDHDAWSLHLDMLAEDLIAGLGRFQTMAVLARHSSFTLTSGDPGVLEAARGRLGADFVIEGTVRVHDDLARLTVSLIDTRSATVRWSDHFDVPTRSGQLLTRDLQEKIVARLAARLDDARAAQAVSKRPTDLVADELMMQGISILRRNEPAEYEKAGELLQAAVSRDPSNGLAIAHLAFSTVMQRGFGRAAIPDLTPALELAARAVTLAPDQPTAHRVLSFVQMYRREFAAAEFHMRKSLELNPYDADSLDQMGYLLTLRGRPQEALTWIERAIALNPIHPSWYEHDRSFALYLLGDYRKAADAIELSPIPPAWMRTWLAACYAQMGDMTAARLHADRITETDPRFSAVDFARKNGAAFEHASDHRHFAEGVLMALGLPLETWSDTGPVKVSSGD